MQDFRSFLYQNYVSKFTHQTSISISSISRRQWYDHKYLPLLKNLGRSDHILDLGCGAGDLLFYLRQRGFDFAEGIDISAEQVKLAREKGLSATQEDVFCFLKDNEQQYAAIVAVDFIEHFTKEELMVLLPLIRNRLQGGGLLMLQTPNGQGLCPNQVIYGDLTHLTIFSPGSLSQLLQWAGFADLQFFETGPVKANVKGMLRLVGWRLVKTMANCIRLVETGKTQRIWTENMICVCRNP